MKHALRAATAVAAIAAGGLFAGTAAAAPPLNYDADIVSQYNSANSVQTIRHLAVDIGPRRSGTPQELEGAQYLKSILDSYGFQTQIYAFPIQTNPNVNVNRAVAQVKSPNATLPNGPNWQFSSSTFGKQTGVANPVTGEVAYAGTGATAADFPANSSGKIILMDQGATTAARTTQVNNAIAAGAIAVIVAATTTGATGIPAAPPTTVALTANVDIPVMGAGRSHLDWMKTLLAAGPLSLTFTTENYINPTRAVVVGRRFAVGDPDGTKAPIVMVGAHIDSVLGAPGAHDDASGNGVSMEIARVVSKLPLDKEIRIGGFGGEEDGLTGSRAYVATLPAAERARFVGEWQMDMVGTPYAPAELWALTPNGQSNLVVDEAYKAANSSGFAGLQNCFLGQSDHQAFFDVGIPSALFIWLNYRKPALPRTCTSGPFTPDYTTEPEYHRPTDGMSNISPERLQTTLNVIGGAFAHNALNRINLTATDGTGAVIGGAKVTGDCGDGQRTFGTTDAAGKLEFVVPHVACDLRVSNGNASAVVEDLAVAGDKALPVSLTSAEGGAGGSVPATLALTLGTPASFGPFTPGITKTYESSTTANVISTAGDATLSVADPSSFATGHLVNGTFSLPQPLQARARNAANTGTAYNNVGSSASPLNLLTYGGPVSNDQVSLQFSQLINSGDALRTGPYSKTLTFTLSTTNP
jgi:hypothetical protein